MTESIIQLPTPGETAVETFDRILRSGPVVPVELAGGVRAWVAASHKAVSEVLANDDTMFTKNTRNCPAFHDGTIPADWPFRALTEVDHMLNKDGEEHNRLRRTISKAFSPARVAALEPRVQQIVDELLDAIPDPGVEVDLVTAFTTPFPVRVICELFGVPASVQPSVRQWIDTVVSTTSTGEQAQAAMVAMLGYLHELLEEKRLTPGDDLTSALLEANVDNELTDDELADMLWLVIAAGHETTVHLLGNVVVELCRHPEQLAKARAEDRWRDVVEEILRFRSSVAFALMRYTRKDVTIAGVDLPAGALVGWYGGVGRDPERRPNADVFDIDHDHRDQLAFGRGTHFCLGTHLARLEGRVALSTLFNRFPNLTLTCAPDEVPYTPNFITCGPITVPVILDPDKAA